MDFYMQYAINETETGNLLYIAASRLPNWLNNC